MQIIPDLDKVILCGFQLDISSSLIIQFGQTDLLSLASGAGTTVTLPISYTTTYSVATCTIANGAEARVGGTDNLGKTRTMSSFTMYLNYWMTECREVKANWITIGY